MSHTDIRIGTLAPAVNGASYLKQMLPHGFESFSLTLSQDSKVDFEENSKEVLDVIGHKAIISSIGFFGNPLQNEDDVRVFEKIIDNVHHYNANLVCGFAGAIQGRPLPESMPKFKEVWGELAKRAEDRGVRIAFENCDAGGWWHDPLLNIAHSPTAWEMMFNEVPSEALGLEWEPCHQMVSLIDPLPQLRKWISRIYHLHGKDATIAWDVLRESGIRGGKPYVWHRTPGFGDTNWTDVISILRMNSWKGSIDIEGWHDPVYKDELETTGQVFGLNYLKQCRGGMFVENPT